ncbi:MAG TPA: methionine aminotransferase [Vicinamibacterales bacterium]|nr:methionine aminotransferase [Vicinamibacterales bacterium]
MSTSKSGILPLASKLPSVGTTIFTVMSRLAGELGAINLSQGFPDFDCDPELIDAVARHMRAGHNQYAPMQGVPALREAIAMKFRETYGASYDPESEVTVTSGGTEALFDALAAIVHPGDEVIVFEPCYDSYVPGIELNGGVPVVVSLTFPEYAIPWNDVRAAITPRTRMLILNSPHNPSGAILSPDDIRELSAIVDGTGLLILSDEVYEHIIFDGVRHESMARDPALAGRSFIVGSFGKTYHATGWKLGYVAAPAPLTAEFRKVHQFVTFASNTPMQYAIAEFVAARRGYPQLAAFFQAKRDLFRRLLDGSRFRALPCHGSYFQLLDYSAITNEDDKAFAIRLTKEHGVASIPTSAFLYRRPAPPVLRFCFAKKDETLARAADRLRAL